MLAAPAGLACKRKCTLRTQATTGQPTVRHSLRNGLRLIRDLLGAPGFLATVAVRMSACRPARATSPNRAEHARTRVLTQNEIRIF